MMACCGMQSQLFLGTRAPSANWNGYSTLRGIVTVKMERQDRLEQGTRVSPPGSVVMVGVHSRIMVGFSLAVSFRKLSMSGRSS